jgi:long-chain acyl-CoA synthetase
MTDLPYVHPTVVHMLIDAAAKAPDREALVYGEDRLNYREYLRCVTAFGNELGTHGAAGGRVALVMRNSSDLCIALFAVHMAGAQATPLNPVYTDNELRPMLEDTAPQVLIADTEVRGTLEGIAADLDIRCCIWIGGATGRRLTVWRNDAELRVPQTLPQPADLCMLQFTGGTTGLAKGANLTHAAIATNISQREALVPTRPETERMLCVMPLFHCYAISMCLHNMAYCRGTLVIMPRYHPQEVLAAMENERITLFGGSPTLFAGLLNFEGFANTDFSQLSLSYSGAAPLAENLMTRWQQTTGAPIVEGYGQSESGPVISFIPVHGKHKLRSVGIPLPATDLQIVDLQSGTQTLARGEQGEIRLRGPQVMQGYRNRPQETAATLRHGWLYTGDIGYLDEDGYLFITGRKKEMIIVSGFNVFPREVEELLYQHASVQEAAVVGRPDDYRGELPVAFVTAREGAEISPQQLLDFCRKNLAAYKVPAEIRPVEALPKTAVGKVDKIRLAAWAASQT